MKKITAFLLGVYEFRRSFTTSFDDLGLLEAYDTGRDLAHAVTLRYFEV